MLDRGGRRQRDPAHPAPGSPPGAPHLEYRRHPYLEGHRGNESRPRAPGAARRAPDWRRQARGGVRLVRSESTLLAPDGSGTRRTLYAHRCIDPDRSAPIGEERTRDRIRPQGGGTRRRRMGRSGAAGTPRSLRRRHPRRDAGRGVFAAAATTPATSSSSDRARARSCADTSAVAGVWTRRTSSPSSSRAPGGAITPR